jgi:hypothetical protein
MLRVGKRKRCFKFYVRQAAMLRVGFNLKESPTMGIFLYAALKITQDKRSGLFPLSDFTYLVSLFSA